MSGEILALDSNNTATDNDADNDYRDDHSEYHHHFKDDGVENDYTADDDYSG